MSFGNLGHKGNNVVESHEVADVIIAPVVVEVEKMAVIDEATNNFEEDSTKEVRVAEAVTDEMMASEEMPTHEYINVR